MNVDLDDQLRRVREEDAANRSVQEADTRTLREYNQSARARGRELARAFAERAQTSMLQEVGFIKVAP